MSSKILRDGRADPGKKTRIPETVEPSPDQLHPVFCLQYIQKSHCLSKCEKAEKAAFADTIFKLSQLTWGEIRTSSRHGSGYEKINRQNVAAGIPVHLTEEINLVAFRFCGKAPMVGYKENHVFHVLWLDRQFNLYKH